MTYSLTSNTRLPSHRSKRAILAKGEHTTGPRRLSRWYYAHPIMGTSITAGEHRSESAARAEIRRSYPGGRLPRGLKVWRAN